MSTSKPSANHYRTLAASLDALATLRRKSASGKRVYHALEALLEDHNKQREAFRKDLIRQQSNNNNNKTHSTKHKSKSSPSLASLPITIPNYDGVLDLVGCNDLTNEEWSAIIAVISTHMNIATVDVTLCEAMHNNKSLRNAFIEAVRRNTSILDVQSDVPFITTAVEAALKDHQKLANERLKLRQMADDWKSVSDLEEIFRAQRASTEENEMSIRQLIEHQWLCSVIPPFEQFRVEAVSLVHRINARARREAFLDNVESIVTDSCITLPNRLFSQFMESLSNMTEHMESHLRSELVNEQNMMRNTIRRRYFKCHEQAANKLMARLKNEHQMRVNLLADCLAEKEITIIAQEASQRQIIQRCRDKGLERLEDFEISLANRKQEIQAKVSSRIEEFHERQKLKAERIAKEQGGKGNITLIVEIDRLTRAESIARAKFAQDEDKTFDLYCEMVFLCRKLSDARDAIAEATASVQSVLDNRIRQQVSTTAPPSPSGDMKSMNEAKNISRSPSPRMLISNHSPSHGVHLSVGTPRLTGFAVQSSNLSLPIEKNEVSLPFAKSDLSISAFRSLQLPTGSCENTVTSPRIVIDLPVQINKLTSFRDWSQSEKLKLFCPLPSPIPTVDPVEIRGTSASRPSIFDSRSSLPLTSRGLAPNSSRSRSTSVAFGSPKLANIPQTGPTFSTSVLATEDNIVDDPLVSALSSEDTPEEALWRENFTVALENLAVTVRYNNSIITRVSNQMESMMNKIHATIVGLQPAPLEHTFSAPVSSSSVFGSTQNRSLRVGGRARSQSLLTNETLAKQVPVQGSITDLLITSNELEMSSNFELAATTGKLMMTRRDSGSNPLLTSMTSNSSFALRRQRTLTAPPGGTSTMQPNTNKTTFVSEYREVLRRKFFPLTETFLSFEDPANSSEYIRRLASEAVVQRRIVRKIIIKFSVDQSEETQPPNHQFDLLNCICCSHPQCNETADPATGEKTFIISTISRLESVAEIVADNLYIAFPGLESHQDSLALLNLEVACVMVPIFWRSSKLSYIAKLPSTSKFETELQKQFFPWLSVKGNAPNGGKALRDHRLETNINTQNEAYNKNLYQVDENHVVTSRSLLRISLIRPVFEMPDVHDQDHNNGEESIVEQHYCGRFVKPFNNITINDQSIRVLWDSKSDSKGLHATESVKSLTLTLKCHGPTEKSALQDWDGNFESDSEDNDRGNDDLSTSIFSGSGSRKTSEAPLTSTATPNTTAMISSLSPEALVISGKGSNSASALNTSTTLNFPKKLRDKTNSGDGTIHSKGADNPPYGGFLLGNGWRCTPSAARKRSVSFYPASDSMSPTRQRQASILSNTMTVTASTSIGIESTSQSFDLRYIGEAFSQDKANDNIIITLSGLPLAFPASASLPLVESARITPQMASLCSMPSFLVTFSFEEVSSSVSENARKLAIVAQQFLRDLHVFVPITLFSSTTNCIRTESNSTSVTAVAKSVDDSCNETNAAFATVQLGVPLKSQQEINTYQPSTDTPVASGKRASFDRSIINKGILSASMSNLPTHICSSPSPASLTVKLIQDDLPNLSPASAAQQQSLATSGIGLVQVLNDQCKSDTYETEMMGSKVAALEIFPFPTNPGLLATSRLYVDKRALRTSVASVVKAASEQFAASSSHTSAPTSNQQRKLTNTISRIVQHNKTLNASANNASVNNTLSPNFHSVNDIINSLRDDKTDGFLMWGKMAGHTSAIEIIQKRHQQLMEQNNNFDQLEFLRSRHQLLRRHPRFAVFDLGSNIKLRWAEGCNPAAAPPSTAITFAIKFEIMPNPSDRSFSVPQLIGSTLTTNTNANKSNVSSPNSPNHHQQALSKGDLLAFLPPYPLTKQGKVREEDCIVHCYTIKSKAGEVLMDTNSDTNLNSQVSEPPCDLLVAKSTVAAFSESTLGSTNVSTTPNKLVSTQKMMESGGSATESKDPFHPFTYLAVQCFNNVLSEGIASSTVVNATDLQGGYEGLLKITTFDDNSHVQKASAPVAAPSSLTNLASVPEADQQDSEATSRGTSPAISSAPTPTKAKKNDGSRSSSASIPRFTQINLLGVIANYSNNSQDASIHIQKLVDEQFLPYIKLLSGPSPKDRSVNIVISTYVSRDISDDAPEMPWNQRVFESEEHKPEGVEESAKDDEMSVSSRTLGTDVIDKSSRKLSTVSPVAGQTNNSTVAGLPPTRRKSFSTSFRSEFIQPEPITHSSTAPSILPPPYVLSLPCALPLLDYLTRYGSVRSLSIPLTVAQCKLWNAAAAKSSSNNSSMTNPNLTSATPSSMYGELTIKVTSDKSSQLPSIGIDENLFVAASTTVSNDEPLLDEFKTNTSSPKSKTVLRLLSPSKVTATQSALTIRIDCTAASECIFRFENTFMANARHAPEGKNLTNEDPAYAASATTGPHKIQTIASANMSINEPPPPSSAPDPLLFIDMNNRTVTYLPTGKVIATIHVTGGRPVPEHALAVLTASYRDSATALQSQLEAPVSAPTRSAFGNKNASITSAPMSLGARRSSLKNLLATNVSPPAIEAIPSGPIFITALESVIEIRFVPDFLDCLVKNLGASNNSSSVSPSPDLAPTDADSSLNNTIGGAGSRSAAPEGSSISKQEKVISPSTIFSAAKAVLNTLLRVNLCISRVPSVAEAPMTSRTGKEKIESSAETSPTPEKMTQYALLTASIGNVSDSDISHLGIKLVCL